MDGDEPSPSAGEVFSARPIVQCLSIHDFVRVDLPIDAVLGAFAHFVTPQLIEQLVRDAWTKEIAAARPNVHNEDASPPPPITVTIGDRRSRLDAVVVPIRWARASGDWLPPLDADLEIVAYGRSSTHLHVLGHSQLHPATELLTARASLEHRLAVALVRHVLAELAAAVTQASGWHTQPATAGSRGT